MKRFLIALLIVLVTGTWAVADANRAQIAHDTGSGALSVTATCLTKCYLRGARIHLSSAATQENVVIWINSAKGSAYDVVLTTQAASGSSDLIWTPDHETVVEAGDTITLQWTNTDARTWGAEIAYEY